MMKGFKIRIFPTKEQEQMIKRHIGSCRFLWNYMIDVQKQRVNDGQRILSKFDMMKLIKPLKEEEEYSWLKDVSNKALEYTCTSLSYAYDLHYKSGHRLPKYKGKKARKNSYHARSDHAFYFGDGFVAIEKLGRVKYKSDFSFPIGRGHKFYNVHVMYENGKYMLSFAMNCENQATELSENSMGIDLGIKDLAVVACADNQYVFHNINKSKKIRNIERRLNHCKRSASRKYESSRAITGKYTKTNNIIKEENKMRKLYARLYNIRHNYIHQVTSKLIHMRPYRVVMEDLNISGMMKNRHISKAVTDQCLYEFIRQMKYKCEWNCIEFIQADRFYPSSKTCSACGCVKKDLKLKDRTYICDECGFTIDRDYNAAINLMRYITDNTQVMT